MRMSNKFTIPDHIATSFFCEHLEGVQTGRDYYARCPVCGDSQRNKRKKRMYLLKEENWFVFCHNCGYSCGLSFFIKDYYPMQYDNVIAQSVSSFYEVNKPQENPDDKASSTIKRLQKRKNHLTGFLKNNCVMLSDIDGIMDLKKKDKMVVMEQIKYIKSRNILKRYYSQFYYCYKVPKKEQFCYKNRIIIPFFKDDVPYFFQARMTNSKQSPKYINWKNPGSNADMKPEYNEHGVDKSKNVFIVEGLFDSFFIENSVSTLGARMSTERMRYFENKYPHRTFLLDNDRDGINVSKKLLERGERCFLMPPGSHKGKIDINDLAIKDNVTDLTEFVENNSFSSLEGIFKMKQYNYV
jgi:hypothetical protein